MKKLFFACMMLATAAASNAQENYSRINVDYLSTTLTTTLENDDYTTGNENGEYTPTYKDYKGFSVGYTYGIGIKQGKPLFVEVDPKLYFLFNKANGMPFAAKQPEGDKPLVSAKGKASDLMMGINIPVNLTYQFNVGKGWTVAPYVGLHAKINIIGRTSYTAKQLDKEAEENSPAEYTEYSESINWFSDGEDDMQSKANTYNRFQYGAQLGVNVSKCKINIHLGWDWDSALYDNWKFNNQAASKNANMKGNTRSLQLGLGYNL